MLYLPYVGLPNILAGEKLVPEFLQDDATPGALAGALLALLRDTGAQRRQVERFREFHHLLRQNTAREGGRRGARGDAMSGTAAVSLVCGVDEAGRGPLAGPVYAAAVILDPARRDQRAWRTPSC